MRIYQWLKNLLLFVPLLLAHRFEDSVAFTQVFAGFFSFGFIASFVYIINDMLDLESDRKHPRKKNRPLASGDLSLKTAFALAPVILIAGIFLSLTLTNHFFTLFLLIYLIITLLYSIIIKSFYILDIIILSLLYTLRLIAGAVSANVYISPWLLEFSIFIFLSLATVKRFTELKTILAQNKTVASGRGYITSDINFLFIIGIVSGFLSALVFTLYIHSEEVVILYKEPIFLWPVSLCFLTWIIRVWFKAHRGEMHDDPVVFTFKDKLSIIIGILIIALITCAIVF
jgi:4-hydroxybenzoate polyprenyltransferase